MADGDEYLSGEARARVEIDRQLGACGWVVQHRKAMNLYAGSEFGEAGEGIRLLRSPNGPPPGDNCPTLSR